ncbi:hypothetical protein ACFVHQ_19300 [Actinomycetes bacterium NPDC127524]
MNGSKRNIIIKEVEDILELTKEQIELATELYMIKENDNVSNEQAQKAFNLYTGLIEKPNLLRGPDVVKPIIDKKVVQLTPDLFKTPERIIYLTRWVLKIVPFLTLFNNVGHLPLTRNNNDFQAYLEDILNGFLEVVDDIYTKIPRKYNLLQDINLDNVKALSSAITTTIKEYYKGYPNVAYDKLAQVIENHLTPNGYLEHIMTLDNTWENILYKMRTGTGTVYSKDEMFHIPFRLRGLVSTNRYSIPGLPCVYLGSSPLTCWEELNKPDLNSVQTSLFVVKNISYLDFSTPPEAVIDKLKLQFQFRGIKDTDMSKIYDELVSYVVLWPLMAACSIRVRNPRDSFKPEYIIPQLLLQWIRQSEFDGISYFSTKVNRYSMKTATFYRNFAFPVQTQADDGYCSVLKEKFEITDAVPWQSFQIYKDSYLALPNEGSIEAELEFVEGMPLLYRLTDFSKLETFLYNLYDREKKRMID